MDKKREVYVKFACTSDPVLKFVHTAEHIIVEIEYLEQCQSLL